MTALGIDIGGSSVKVALIRDGAIAATGQSPRYLNPSGRPTRSLVAAAISAALPPEARFRTPDLIGLCAPGVYDPASRTITTSINMPGLVGVRLDELLAEAFGRAVPLPAVRTDAHAAAFDYWASHKPAGRLLGVSIGTGVGACVLDQGHPLRITGPSSGHLGQIDVSITDTAEPIPVGADGGRGSLEAYIGLPALIRRYGPELQGAFTEDGPAPPLLALARALRIAHAIYRPDAIALLGGGGLLLKASLETLHDLIADGLTSLARPGWTIACGDHHFHAAAGAGRLAADHAAPR